LWVPVHKPLNPLRIAWSQKPIAMFSIEIQNLTLQLEIVPVDSLFSHEAVIADSASKLILEFKNLASLQNPIIVEENHVVLDGNHRAYAFKTLNLNYIPVCKIDYFNQRTKLRYWFRRLGNLKPIDQLHHVIADLGGTRQRVSDGPALKNLLEENPLACGIQYGDAYTLVDFPQNSTRNALTAYDTIQSIQDELTSRGITIDYVACNTVLENTFCEQLKPDEAVIWTPQITKQMVIETARMEKVFAPKTTRHVIPVRPLNVNVPGQWFKERISLEVINDRFSEFIETKRIRRFNPGMVLDGRYYEEALVVFY